MKKSKKEAIEKLRQLVNSNFEDDEVEISISYVNCSSKTETSYPGGESRSTV